jgi:hypothetical protein
MCICEKIVPLLVTLDPHVFWEQWHRFGHFLCMYPSSKDIKLIFKVWNTNCEVKGQHKFARNLFMKTWYQCLCSTDISGAQWSTSNIPHIKVCDIFIHICPIGHCTLFLFVHKMGAGVSQSAQCLTTDWMGGVWSGRCKGFFL